MKRILKIKFVFLSCIILILFSSLNYAQIHSVNVFGDYSTAFSKRLEVSKGAGFGGGIIVRYDVADFLFLNISGGYSTFNVEQNNAIGQWNWRFWEERYKGNVDLYLQDSIYNAFINPVQTIDIYSIFLSLGTELNPLEKFTVKITAGGGILFYARKLHLEETWQKFYNDIDYTFEYSYRNFAPYKYGNPISVQGGLELGYEIYNGIKLFTSTNYLYVLKTDNMGYDTFPLNDILNIKFGITFLY